MKMPHGIKAYRIVAMIRDNVFDHWCCFFDVKTKKIFIEEVQIPHAGTWDASHCFQVADDSLWCILVEFLQKPDINVLQTVEIKYEKDKDHYDSTGEKRLVLSNGLFKLPADVLGVDQHGSTMISQGMSLKDIKRLTQSPSEWSDEEMPSSTRLIV